MAATAYGSKVSLNANSVNQVEPKFLATGTVSVVSTITPTAAGLNDVWYMLDVPANATITGMALDSDDLDSNGSPTIKLDVIDDQQSPHTFISQSTVAQAGGVVADSSLTAGSIGLTYTANQRIHILVHTAAATFQSGTVRLRVSYSLDA